MKNIIRKIKLVTSSVVTDETFKKEIIPFVKEHGDSRLFAQYMQSCYRQSSLPLNLELECVEKNLLKYIPSFVRYLAIPNSKLTDKDLNDLNHLKQVARLNVASNQLNGDFLKLPFMQTVQVLQLNENPLSDDYEQAISVLPKLKNLVISGKHMTGNRSKHINYITIQKVFP